MRNKLYLLALTFFISTRILSQSGPGDDSPSPLYFNLKQLAFNFLRLWFFLLPFNAYTQSQWHYLPNTPLEADRYEDVFFISDTEGWAVSLSGVIIHTTDGGNSWYSQRTDTLQYRSVEFVDNHVGFAGTMNNQFLKTTDGGQNWQIITPLIPDTAGYKSVCGMSHVGTNNIYAVGAWNQPGHFFMSHDAGNTWNYQNLGTVAAGLVECNFMDSLTGFISGTAGDSIRDGIILKTIDGGQTWRTVFTSGNREEYVWKLQFLNDSLGFAAIENTTTTGASYMARTVDGGNTWTKKIVSNYNIDEEGMGFADSLHGWVGGYITGMFETFDGGDSWHFLNFGENLNRVFFLRPDLIYAAGSSIYRFGDMPTGIQNVRTSRYLPHQLFPCYPNPFNHSTTISFELSEWTFAKLDVYDAQGRWIRNLLNQQSAPGKYSLTFSCEECAAGEYRIILGTNERFLAEPIQLINKR